MCGAHPALRDVADHADDKLAEHDIEGRVRVREIGGANVAGKEDRLGGFLSACGGGGEGDCVFVYIDSNQLYGSSGINDIFD